MTEEKVTEEQVQAALAYNERQLQAVGGLYSNSLHESTRKSFSAAKASEGQIVVEYHDEYPQRPHVFNNAEEAAKAIQAAIEELK